MRVNEETVLVGSNVVLVPYRKQHVQKVSTSVSHTWKGAKRLTLSSTKYHEWMSDPAIRQQTASEPLTIEEEYDMQRTWHTDDDKLTFIVLARQAEHSEKLPTDVEELLSSCPMVGDTNIFISERLDDDDDDQTADATKKTGKVMYDAELEVMIAEQTQRRRGLAKEALALLMNYVCANSTLLPAHDDKQSCQSKYLPLSRDAFVAKVGLANAPSIALFTKLGFHEVKQSHVWNEAELRPNPAATLDMQAPLAVLRWPKDDM